MASVAAPPASDLVEALSLERNLYRGLLNIGAKIDDFDYLHEALDLVLKATGAASGYLEVFDEPSAEPAWWTAAGCSDDELNDIREAVSQGIIGAAIASGETILTPCALLDPRFQHRRSVRRSNIEAAICSPIGDGPPLGVLYLQGPIGKFSEDDVEQARLVARHLAPMLRHTLTLRQNEARRDATAEVRSRLIADEVVGRSAAVAAMLEEISLVSRLDVSVLITGETGTGKSQLARVIHLNGPRRHGNLVELNCAAIPENLMESELFGAMAGAHSTATQRIQGKVAAADGGTLVLDEITELSISAQAKLLQLLQTHEYYPLGASRPSKADVRVVACTNVDLATEVEEKRFREDLFYRLRVLPIRVPTLSERMDDIDILATHFCERASQRHDLPSIKLSLGALVALRATTWRGNVRELAHVVEAGTIRAAGGNADRLEASHLFGPQDASGSNGNTSGTFQERTRQFQRQLLASTLEQTAWNVAETARQLDLARSHVYNLIKAFGLARQDD